MPMFVEALINRLLKKIFNRWPKKETLLYNFWPRTTPILANFFQNLAPVFLNFAVHIPKEM